MLMIVVMVVVMMLLVMVFVVLIVMLVTVLMVALIALMTVKYQVFSLNFPGVNNILTYSNHKKAKLVNRLHHDVYKKYGFMNDDCGHLKLTTDFS